MTAKGGILYFLMTLKSGKQKHLLEITQKIHLHWSKTFFLLLCPVSSYRVTEVKTYSLGYVSKIHIHYVWITYEHISLKSS